MGDDAAVVRAGGAVSVTSTDMAVEDVHFRLREGWATPAEVGHRALAAALSDLAAMGARAGEAYLSLGLPPGFPERDALALVRAADALALRCDTAIAGGDVVAAPALTVSVTVVGWADRAEDLVARSGAAPGELLGVTGRLGAAAAALAVREGRLSAPAQAERALAGSLLPTPRLRAGAALARAGVSAMIDISDGLATDASHLARASGVELLVHLPKLPLAQGLTAVADALGVGAGELAAVSGEEYELCFTAPAGAREAVELAAADAGVSWIGEAGEGPGAAVLLGGGGEVVRAQGFEHRW